MPDPEDQDLGQVHQERLAQLDEKALFERMSSIALESAAETGLDAAASPRDGSETGQSLPSRISKDVGLGLIEGPRAIIGGVLDAVGSTVDLVEDLASPSGGKVTRAALEALEGAEEADKQMANPLTRVGELVDEPASTTGSMIRNIAQFASGFAATGSISGLKRLQELGRAGTLTSNAIRGAITDFTVFDPHEERLSNLIERFPKLQNPVTEYLAASPEDSEAEGRFKNALEGLGIGTAVDGLLSGVKLLKNARRARPVLEQGAEQLEQVKAAAKTQEETLVGLLGDPKKPAFKVKPVSEEAAGAAFEAAEGEVAGPAGKVFVNWSRINSDDDLKQLIQKLADARSSEIKTAQRGVRKWRDTRQSAEQIDAWDTLMSRKRGESLNAEQTVAVRELWTTSSEQVRSLAAEVAADPSPVKKIAFRKQLALHNAIQDQVLGARTETARALNAWGIPVGASDDAVAFSSQLEKLGNLVSNDRDVVDIAERITMLSDAGLTREADAFVYGMGFEKASGMVRQLFYGSMLSSPHTQIRNIVGNTATIPLQMAERKFANLLGRTLGNEQVATGEVAAQLFGLQKGIRDSFVITSKGRRALGTAARRLAARDTGGARTAIADNASEFGTVYRSAATGETGIGINRLELPQRGAFDPENFAKDAITGLPMDRESPIGIVLSFLDTVTQSPMRALGAADEAFKTMTYNMELNAQAFRQAKREMAAGNFPEEAFADRLADLVSNPDERLRFLAEKFAKVSTFTNKPLDTAPWKAARAWQNIPVVGRITLPFRSTPYNIATFNFQRTPLAPFVKQWRQDVLAGGAEGQLAWSKMLVGTGIMMGMADLALRDQITGQGPEDPRQREQWQRSGQWQPNSIQIGNRWVSYQGLEPLSSPIGLAANTVDILRFKDWDDDDVQIDELVIASSLAVAAQLTSQQYMRGISDFFDAMSDPQRNGERWFQNVGSLVVPRGISLAARLEDPTLRMAEDILDSIRRQTLGLSKDLPPMRDAWGRTIDRSSGLGGLYDFLVPQRTRSMEGEPIDIELNRLEKYITRPPKRVTFDGVTVNMELFPKIYSRYLELAGNALTTTKDGAPIGLAGRGAKDELNALVSGKHPLSPVYDLGTDGPDGGKAEMIENIVNDYRDAAKDVLREEFPELDSMVRQRLAEKPGRFDFGGARP